jgi:hypothetical protein
MAKRRSKREADLYERCARARLEPILGPLRDIDPGGGPQGLHDFEADLPGGFVAAIEVTSEVERRQRELESLTERRFSAFTLPGSGWRWLVALDAGARVKDISSGDLRLLLYDMEKQGRRDVHCRGDYRDPLVQRLRGLRIESVYSWAAGARAGTVVVGPGVYGGWGWAGAATDAWLGDFLASLQGANKLQKLGRANATGRHLVIMLDPRSQAGMCIPVGLTDWRVPGAGDAVLPSFAPPEPLTNMWLIPMVAAWLGLSWTRDRGWAVLDRQAGPSGRVTDPAIPTA